MFWSTCPTRSFRGYRAESPLQSTSTRLDARFRQLRRLFMKTNLPTIESSASIGDQEMSSRHPYFARTAACCNRPSATGQFLSS
jgi:hypothetical protein